MKLLKSKKKIRLSLVDFEQRGPGAPLLGLAKSIWVLALLLVFFFLLILAL